MIIYNCVALYDAAGKIKCDVMHPDKNFRARNKTDQGDPGCSYQHVDPVSTKDSKTVYLVRWVEALGSRLGSRGIEAYIIKNKKLTKYPFFQTKTKTLDSIGYTIDALPAGSLTEMRLTENGHKLEIPVVAKGGKPPGRYLTYRFDGNKFVFVGK